MITRNFNSVYDEIDELEKKRMNYLEVNDKVGARRIQKQIEKAKLEKELAQLKEIKKELSMYKMVVSNYPSLESEIKRKLLEQKQR